MKLFFYGHEGLSWTEYQPVEIRTAADLVFLRSVEQKLVAVVEKYKRSGFTAPQMGIPIQMAVVRLGGGMRVTLLNPRIERMYGTESIYPETCISCPPGKNSCGVARMHNIEVSAKTLERPWQDQAWTFKGKDARIVQHEVDHLQGTFFFDRANLVEKDRVITAFQQWKFKFRKNGHAFSC